MEIQNNSTVEIQTNSLRDYIKVVRYYLKIIIIILSATIMIAIIYAYQSENIYTAVTQIKITQPKGNILASPSANSDFQSIANDRFIATEILQLKSKNFRNRVATSLLDSFKAVHKPAQFNLLLQVPPKKAKGGLRVVDQKQLANRLGSAVTIEQIRGLDVIQLTVESPSAYEVALIANCYAKVYQGLSVEINRDQLSLTKNFLATQKDEKSVLLNTAETDLKVFQEQKGFVSLDNQASTLITQISQIESQLNFAKIELASSDKLLERYKAEINKNDPKIAHVMETAASEEYLKTAQAEIAKLQLAKDLALIDKSNTYYDPRVEKETNYKINELNKKIADRMSVIKDNLAGKGIEDFRNIIQKDLEEEIKNQSLRISINEMTKIFNIYEHKFNQLPKSSIEFAGLKRNQEGLEKLYTLVEGRYQEALINEQSQPGYVSIVDYADIPGEPSKPNRSNIILMGFFIGLVVSLGYAFIRNFFDDTIKTPEDIEKRNINVLSWIPLISILGSGKGKHEFEFVVLHQPQSVPAEAFKTLRSRVQFSKIDKESLRTILVTSAAMGEGKTTISANLAGSFALSDAKTLVLDCDFRKPRVHTFFNGKRSPGVVDYIFGRATMDEIVYPTEMKNLFYIPCGQIPPNPTELLQSAKMTAFFAQLKTQFDYILIDSPPIVAVTDAEILARICDVTILIVSAEQTKTDMMIRVVNSLSSKNVGFIGAVLNKFDFKSSYGSYYKYYYYYSSSKPKKRTSKI
jgi:tyrosine-protein kinase Etk/Wzc